MPGAPTGFLGKLSAERPFLVTSVLALAVTALCVLGVRHSADPASGLLILKFAAAAAAIVCAPLALAALTPQKLVFRILFLVLITALGAGLVAAAFGATPLGGSDFAPPRAAAGAGLGLFVFLAALAPLTRSTLRLGLAGPLAAVIGAVGGVGYFALENLVVSPFSAAAAAIALMGGVSVGIGVGADFAQHFARGLAPKDAAAAAGHGAVAPAAFSVLAALAYMSVVTFQANFGAVDWRLLAAAGAAALIAAAAALTIATGVLSIFRPSEQVAVDENRRRQRFAESWRPFRKRLPATTALAASAIAGVLTVVAAFETGVPEGASLAVFLVFVLVAAGLAFVSVRTSLLIVVILFLSAVFTHYIYAVFAMTAPAAAERFAGLALSAIALSQLTVSWRNASDIWRNARDVAQNAMSDGLRRFAIAYGAGGAATVACAYAFSWEGGVGAAAYFAIHAGIGLFLAPFFMVALSAQFQRY
ncbi:hypothetical protein [Hyphococcus luteus]|uniref:hypothetical protein n=1 Tax=Hyphococcus luteus TaxID=2058213 RepID=UPI0013FD5EFE|nr:hypothetical protein [Marinicaulis flavus]